MTIEVKCSLVIATYNWPKALYLCLLSIINQEHLPDEIIVADDGSGLETLEVVENFQKISTVPVYHVWHKDKGFRKTIILNKAIHKSSYDYIIQIDGDVVLERHFIGDHLASAEPNAFIRGTRAMLSPERTRKVLDNKDINISWLSYGVQHRNNALRFFALRGLGARKVMSSNSVRGSNISYWRSDFVMVNGYDNELKGWGHEDEELAARFINNKIIKKIVKLCAVQYHLWHNLVDKDNEPLQRQIVDKVKYGNLKQCVNGYLQVVTNE
jgi:glycosyltransferase involved in cell wall biosynthesis